MGEGGTRHALVNCSGLGFFPSRSSSKAEGRLHGCVLTRQGLPTSAPHIHQRWGWVARAQSFGVFITQRIHPKLSSSLPALVGRRPTRSGHGAA